MVSGLQTSTSLQAPMVSGLPGIYITAGCHGVGLARTYFTTGSRCGARKDLFQCRLLRVGLARAYFTAGSYGVVTTSTGNLEHPTYPTCKAQCMASSSYGPTVSGPQASTSVQAPMVSGLQTSTSLQAPVVSGLQASESLQAATVSGLHYVSAGSYGVGRARIYFRAGSYGVGFLISKGPLRKSSPLATAAPLLVSRRLSQSMTSRMKKLEDVILK